VIAAASARDGRGVTLVEAIVGLAVVFLVLSMTWALYMGAGGGTRRAIEASDALRSVLLASEAIRRDAGEMIFQADRDLGLLDGGRRLVMLVPATLRADLWGGRSEPVEYFIRKAPRAAAGALVRKTPSQERTVGGCLLADMMVTYIPAGALAPLSAYLEVTLTGAATPGASAGATYTASFLLPLARLAPPAPYPLVKR
jgi:type II secretory pathway pseudopilin PulG